MTQQYLSNNKQRTMMAFLAIAIIVSIVLSILGVPQVKAAGTPIVFRVDGNGNITANGVAFRVKGGSWFGLQGRHEPSNDTTNPSGAPLEQYVGNVFWNMTTRTYAGDVAEFKAMGINVVRVPVTTQTLTGTDPQGMAPNLKNNPSVVIANSKLALETVIKELDAAGIYVLLDIHSCSNYVDWRKGRLDARPPYVDAARDNYDFKREDSSCAATNNPATVTRIQAYDTTKWLADLTTLANMESTLGVSNIIGIDIFNEPWDYTWADWSALAGQAYTAINTVNPNILVFVEGVSDSANNQDGTPTTTVVEPSGLAPAPNWGGNLASAGINPPAIPKDRLVYSPHVYGPSVFVGKEFVDNSVPACVGLSGDAAGDAKCPLIMPPLATFAAAWDSQFGYLKAQGYAIVIGEWGGNMQWPKGKSSLRDQARFSYVTDTTLDQQWQNLFADYLISRGIADTIYWSINPESGDTGGLYTHLYDPVSNTGGWGTWGALDTAKMTLVHRLWDIPVVTGPTATPSNTITPGGPTLTKTATSTITKTPTITPTSTPNTGFKLQYKAADTNATDGQVKPHFIIVNTSAASVALSGLKIRYYFADSASGYTSYCDYANLNCSNVTTSIASMTPVTGADHYLEVGFSAGAGSIAPGATSGEIQTRFNRSDWSNLNESDDYSFDPTKINFADWTKVALYNNGVLVWGTPPGGSGPVATATSTVTVTTGPVLTSTATATRTVTVTTGPTLTATATRTVTVTTGPTLTATATATRTVTVTTGPTATVTRTPTITPTSGVLPCTPVSSTITAPFSFDGAGTFCWQSSNLGTFINSWNTASVSINGVSIANVYTPASSYPAKVGGFWYVSYNSTVAWGHFEAK